MGLKQGPVGNCYKHIVPMGLKPIVSKERADCRNTRQILKLTHKEQKLYTPLNVGRDIQFSGKLSSAQIDFSIRANNPLFRTNIVKYENMLIVPGKLTPLPSRQRETKDGSRHAPPCRPLVP